MSLGLGFMDFCKYVSTTLNVRILQVPYPERWLLSEVEVSRRVFPLLNDIE